MAELATIARPYAEALFKALGDGDAVQLASQVSALGAVAGNAQLRQFAQNPKVRDQQVFDLVAGAVGMPLAERVQNLLHAVIDNGRLAALPEIAAQFHALVNARSGVSDAVVYSAFELDAAQAADLAATLEKRFGRRLQTEVRIDPSLIGGVRVVVGDEVLDTSVRARLEQMRLALTS